MVEFAIYLSAVMLAALFVCAYSVIRTRHAGERRDFWIAMIAIAWTMLSIISAIYLMNNLTDIIAGAR